MWRSRGKDVLMAGIAVPGGMPMRIAVSALALLLAGAAAQAQQVEVISANPRHIEIASTCWSWNCQLEASDVAQGICHEAFAGGPRRALLVRSEPVDRSFFQE